MTDNPLYDIAVIGGGINGCGIARDAAGRGLKVFLCEAGDLGRATSSASSKLIHGGLRYLEQYAFRLVRESLRERAVLRKTAPHLVTPLRFVLPHRPGLRPAWLIRAGLLLYDSLGGRRGLPSSGRADMRAHHRDAALRAQFSTGFEYADCWVDDARLVVTVAKDARRLGATIATRARCESAARVGACWEISVRGTGAATQVRAKALVNATGPWVGHNFVVDACGAAAATTVTHAPTAPAIRLVQGSHIVVKKWYPGAHAYLLQNPDRRVVFVIPFAYGSRGSPNSGGSGDSTAPTELALIGTTEVDYRGDPAGARCTAAEADYLRATVAEYFAVNLAPGDIVWSFSGVRPLFDDGAADARKVTRDYRLVLDAGPGDGAPLLTVYGGKLTTFRRLAEAALAKLAAHFPAAGPAWTADAVLPGARPGDTAATAGAADNDTVDAALRRAYPFLPPALRARYAAAYGWEAFDMLGDAARIDDLGRHFGHGVYAREADYQTAHEWANTAEDILWRRTKLGLRFQPQQAAALEQHLAARDSGIN